VAAKTKVGEEESSDQKMVVGMSGKGETDETDHFGSIINSPGENDINEFEQFMNGISSNLKQKEEAKKRKL